MTNCPCCSGKPLNDCCGPYLQNLRSAPTAEALMRSRYTAYTLLDTAYLNKTSKTSKNGDFDEASVTAWAQGVTWLNLDIVDVKDGTAHDKQGEVSYIVRYKERNSEKVIAEQGLFKKIDNEWFYVGAKQSPPSTKLKKVGRNDPCPCGSGLKFKKCCQGIV